MFAGRPRQALRILAQRLSDAVEGAAADASRGEAWAGLGASELLGAAMAWPPQAQQLVERVVGRSGA